MIDIDWSDSGSSSAGDYSSPEDGDYNIADDGDDDNGDDSDLEDDSDDDDLVLEDAKTKALRQGFSLNAPDASTPGKPNKNDEWLSTQPASQSATKTTKRISPRRKAKSAPIGITGAIVGAIKGDTANLVIPKKKKFQVATEQTQTQQLQQQLQHIPTMTNGRQQHTQLKKSNVKAPPIKKRKVSLSPTDSLARQRPSMIQRTTDNDKREEVIDLFADGDSDDDDVGSWLGLGSLPSKKTRLSKEEDSASLLAAANKQQKEYIKSAVTKQKQNSIQTTSQKKINTTETIKPPKQRLSKVSEVSYAEHSGIQPIENPPSRTRTQLLPPTEIPKAKQEDNTKQKVPAAAAAAATATAVVAASSTKTKKSSSTTKDNVPPKASALEETKPNKTVATKTNSAATKSKAKTAKATKTKPTTKGAVVIENTNQPAPKAKPKATTAKSPPKKKKKRITFEHELLQKMFMACRPYSIKDLMQLMGRTTSEASVNFCLLGLIDKKWVIKKEFKSGSRTKELYWANQESKDKKLWALEFLQLPNSDTIRNDRLELATLQQRDKSLSKQIVDAENTPSNQQVSVLCQTAQIEVNDLMAQLESMKGRIVASSSSSSSHNTKTNKLGGVGGGSNNRFGQKQTTQRPKKKAASTTPLQLKKRINAMRDHWIKRKRKCMDFVDSLADGMEKKVKDVVNKVLELETDEVENAVLPPRHAL